MDYEAIARNISKFRKEKGLTQEGLAEKLGVSAQAISKWENGQSYPDISLLPKLADIFEISIDDLFSHDVEQAVSYVPETKRKNINDMILKIKIISEEGDKVQVNLPAPLFKIVKMGGLVNLGDSNNIDLSSIDIDKIFELIDQGAIGKLVEIQSSNGDIVEIYVE